MSEIDWPEKHHNSKCCHDVLAMLSGRPVEEIIELSKTIGLGGDMAESLSPPCMRRACRKLGIETGELEVYKGWLYPGNPFPPNCIIFTWIKVEGEYEMGSHVILRDDNFYYDPYHWGKRILNFPSNQIPTRYLEIKE